MQTGFAVDRRRMRLLGEAVSMYYDQYVSYQPTHVDWRIWDLRSGTLLFERSARVNWASRGEARWDGKADWSDGGRPPAFDDHELVWAARRSHRSVPDVPVVQTRLTGGGRTAVLPIPGSPRTTT